MTDQVRYVRNPDFVFRRIADELVLVPVKQNVAEMDAIYALNAVGALLWERLDRPTTAADLQAAVLTEYEAEPETVAGDLEVFLRDLASIGAIREA